MTPPKPSNHRKLVALLNSTMLSAYFYVFMEWVFQATKPSSVSNLAWFEEIKVLILTGGAVALPLLAGAFSIAAPSLFIRSAKWKEGLITAGRVIPAFTLSVTALIMFDNFTYTIFKTGVITGEGLIRYLYALGVILILLWNILALGRNTWIHKRPASILALALLILSTIGFATIYASNDPDLQNPPGGVSGGEHPNIIILGADGLSAKYLSAYGYSLNTTPFLGRLRETSLFAENAFPNGASTTASTTSVLTGREPADVRVFRFPDILTGRDSFYHLPGILKRNGYLTVEIGTPYYVDAGRLNLLDGFDIDYNQSIDLSALDGFLPILGNSPSMYFLKTIVERADERLLHVFLDRKMENPVIIVHDPGARISDTERVKLILNTIDNADRPVFIFTHMMDTHGPMFASGQYVFSHGPSSREWDVNNYLDAILTFDGHVREVYDHLEKTGKLNNTILVIYTDHGFGYTIDERIPIMIHFPADEYARRVKTNVQIIDIPATLLDYLDLPQPPWMSGVSFLRDDPPADRLILSINSGAPEKIAPPFYQINILQGIVCDQWYRLDVRKNEFKTGRVAVPSDACDPEHRSEDVEIRRELVQYLEAHGYDTRSLHNPNQR